MPSKTDLINISAINSYIDVSGELKKLSQYIPTSNIGHLLLFNDAYLIVTEAIHQAGINGFFNNPEFIEKFTVCFSHYYFQAINSTLSNNPELPDAWRILNKTALRAATPNFIYLMMGANAHINHDLPLALNKLMGKEKTEDLLQDVLKIDKILMKSGREIIDLFDEPNKLLNFLKRNLIFLYYRPTMYAILYWRIKAYHNYREIKEHGLIASNYQKTSIKTAKRLSLISRLLG
jgi:hypothetical protein